MVFAARENILFLFLAILGVIFERFLSFHMDSHDRSKAVILNLPGRHNPKAMLELVRSFKGKAEGISAMFARSRAYAVGNVCTEGKSFPK